MFNISTKIISDTYGSVINDSQAAIVMSSD